MARRDVVSTSNDGTELRGWNYPAGPGGPSSPGWPVVVLGHGYGAVKEMYLNTIAGQFSDSGLACLVYDHRGLGASGGLVRQELDPQLQISDMRDAITFAHPPRSGSPIGWACGAARSVGRTRSSSPRPIAG